MSPHSLSRAGFNALLALGFLTIPAFADVSGNLQYTDDGTSITITGYDGNKPVGDLTIPPTIIGKNVTSIGDNAFSYCSQLTNVSIPPHVIVIGNSAFTGCSRITNLEIPASVTSLGNSAFLYCSGLTDVVMHDGITSIQDYTFDYCSNLKSVTIPSTVTSIGASAFNSCYSLTNVAIPVNVTSIGNYAFSSCSDLTTVTIPASVSSIGDSAFQNCTSLVSFNVDSANQTYFSNPVDGVLLNNSQTTLIQYPAHGVIASYTIPSTVTSIASTAFTGCSGLTSVTIPNSVTSIGSYAFNSCGLLTSVNIPPSVTSIGNGAFSQCSGLTAFTVDSSNQNYSDLGGALFDKSKTTFIQYPPSGAGGVYVLPPTVTSIGDNSFQDCYSLTGVTLQPGVTSIGSYAFSYCINLDSLTLPASVTSIGDSAFVGCIKIATLILSDNLTSIGNSAFSNCRGLTSVTIPAAVTNIGYTAFSYCNKMTSATFLGNAPTTMSSQVFDSAASGFTVYYTSGSTGFTSPTWKGYPAVATGSSSPLASWQAANGLSTSVDMLSTPNHDGVSLLMDYALGLNPAVNESGNLPQAVVTANTLQISFSCDTSRTDVSYTVQASSSLASGDWTDIAVSTGGAAVHPVGPLSTVIDSGTGVRTATVIASTTEFPQGHGFLRMKVSAP